MSRFAVLGLAFASLVAAAPAAAQESNGQLYVGAVAGYHSLEADVPGSDGGAIFGGVIGYDFNTSGNLVIGVEGNANIGTSAIDADYGVAGRLGYRFPSGGIAYVRGGYQWVDVDINKVAGFNTGYTGDTTIDDYLVGVGGEFPLGKRNMRLRVGVDTVSFDTIRPTAGLIVGF